MTTPATTHSSTIWDKLGNVAAGLWHLATRWWVITIMVVFVGAWWASLQVSQVRIIHWGPLPVPIGWNGGYNAVQIGNENASRTLGHDYKNSVQNCTDTYTANHNVSEFTACVKKAQDDYAAASKALGSTPTPTPAPAGGGCRQIPGTNLFVLATPAPLTKIPVQPIERWDSTGNKWMPMENPAVDALHGNAVKGTWRVRYSANTEPVYPLHVPKGSTLTTISVAGMVKLNDADCAELSPSGSSAISKWPHPEAFLFKKEPSGHEADAGISLVRFDAPGVAPEWQSLGAWRLRGEVEAVAFSVNYRTGDLPFGSGIRTIEFKIE